MHLEGKYVVLLSSINYQNSIDLLIIELIQILQIMLTHTCDAKWIQIFWDTMWNVSMTRILCFAWNANKNGNGWDMNWLTNCLGNAWQVSRVSIFSSVERLVPYSNLISSET